MIFNTNDKEKISSIVMERYTQSGFSSMEKFAKTLGLHASDMTNISKENWRDKPHLIGDGKWVRIARHVGYQKNERLQWKTAETDVYVYMQSQLQVLQSHAMTAIFVDDAGIGKTYTLKEYARKHKNVFYLDCSVTPRRNAFIRALARAVGVGDEGKLDELLDESIYALQQMEHPLVLLDEAGDIDDRTLLVIKRIYNALEDVCGFYLVGSDGMKRKIERGLSNKKLGYTEFFSRFGKKFSSYMPLLHQEKKEILAKMAEQIAVANGITEKQALKDIVISVWSAGLGDMRKIKREIIKNKI